MLNNTNKINKLPFENTLKPPDLKLNEFNNYKRKQVKSNIMSELFAGVRKAKQRSSATPTPGAVNKNILKPKQDIMYFNHNFSRLQKVSERNKYKWNKSNQEDNVNKSTIAGTVE